MPLDDIHLQYRKRRYGMDHERYDWSMLANRPKVRWPNDVKLAIWVNVCLQFFPLNPKGEPFKVTGGMTMPYPDLRHFTLRDYGNRVGIFRILKALDRYGVKPTIAMNTMLAKRNSYLMDMIKDRGDELICHGLHMDAVHYGGQSLAEEQKLVQSAVNELRELSGQAVTGWLSPDRSESENTPDLLAQEGIKYFCDWVNDDMPYEFRTHSSSLISMPLSNELDDVFILMKNQHSESSYVEQICDAVDFFLEEAKAQGGRILGLNIHPWMLGQPHRIARFENVLEHVMSQSGVWSATATEILDSFIAQTSRS